MRSVKDAARSVISPVLKQAGFAQAQVILNWSEIVGGQIAQLCQPARLQCRPQQRVHGVLLIDVVPGAALLVQAGSHQIRERVNSFLGYQAVAEIKIRQQANLKSAAAVPQKSPPKKSMVVDVSMLESEEFNSTPDLKDTLKRFALAMMNVKAILVSVLLGSGGAWAAPEKDPGTVATSKGTPTHQLREKTLGDEKAPVTIVLYTSLTCDHCAQFHLEVFGLLREKYIKNGQVRLIMRDYVSDGWALRAAALCHCLPPAKYLEGLQAFFATQKDWIYAKDYVGAMATVVKPLGLKRTAVNACLADEALLNGILQWRIDGAKVYKIDRTPWMVINGKSYPGAMTPKELEIILCQLLDAGASGGTQ
jgi:protein-disulfide isomerase